MKGRKGGGLCGVVANIPTAKWRDPGSNPGTDIADLHRICKE